MNTVKLLSLICLTMFHSLLFAQQEKNVKVKTGHGKLFGTLLTPEDKKDVPVVLIIAGSGPTDRNGNSMMLQSNSYKMLANALVEEGIASLRYDKQGIGESAEARLAENELTIEHLVNDVIAWIQYLKKKENFSTIIIIGHSQGSLLGMLAAKKEKVDGYISLAGAGNTIDKILEKQLAVGAADYEEDTERILNSLRAGDTTHNVPAQLLSIFRPTIQPFLVSWIKYDPVEEIAKLNVPIMVIQGTTDIQVKTEEAKLLAESAKVEPVLINQMNHVLKSAPEDREKNIQTYYDPKLTLHDELTPTISKFIQNL